MASTFLKYLLLVQSAYATSEWDAKCCNAASIFEALSLIQYHATAIDGKARAVGAVARNARIPSHKKIGILLRGQTFRAQVVGHSHLEKPICDDRTVEHQLNYTKSLLEQVIQPFEAYGNRVQVVSTMQPCRLNSKINEVLSKHLVEIKTFNSESQSSNVLHALDIFSRHYGGVDAVAKHLDYVLVVRHDLQWLASIAAWDNDFDSFSFLARCNPRAAPNTGGSNCVHDIVQWMPAKLFPIFYTVPGRLWQLDKPLHVPDARTVEAMACFHDGYSGDGHGCYYPLQQALAYHNESTDISFLTPVRIAPKSWNPLLNLGRVNPILEDMIKEHKAMKACSSWQAAWNGCFYDPTENGPGRKVVLTANGSTRSLTIETRPGVGTWKMNSIAINGVTGELVLAEDDEQVIRTFQRGAMGISYDDDGLVEEVFKHGAAYHKGITEGQRIVQVGGSNFSKAAIVAAEKSGQSYNATFRVHDGQFSTLLKWSNGLCWQRCFGCPALPQVEMEADVPLEDSLKILDDYGVVDDFSAPPGYA